MSYWLNFFTPKINLKSKKKFSNATLFINKTFIYWQNLPTYTSSYLPMHLQIVNFDYRNYNVKCGYCKGVVTSICSLIQTCDDDKPLTPNVSIGSY